MRSLGLFGGQQSRTSSRYVGGGGGNSAAAEAAAKAQIERFRQHESLLNGVLDCDFAESEATLSLSEDAKAELTMSMLSHILTNALEANDTQALLIIEDAQWMDSASWAFLNRLAEVVSTVSVLITLSTSSGGAAMAASATTLQVATAAAVAGSGNVLIPAYELSQEGTDFLKNTRIVHHEVRPLERTEIHELLCARLLVNKVQQEVVDTVFDRTSGNALYCIELANTMHQRAYSKCRTMYVTSRYLWRSSTRSACQTLFMQPCRRSLIACRSNARRA